MNFEKIKTSWRNPAEKKEEVLPPEKDRREFLDEQKELMQERDLEFEESMLESREDDLEKIKSLEKAAGFDLAETKQELQQEIREDEDYIFETRVVSELRLNVMDHIGSEAYLQRLAKEFDGDLEKARQEQKRRISNLESVEIKVKSLEEVNREKGKIEGISGDQVVAGFYNASRHVLFVAGNITDYEDYARHEIFHASTKGAWEVSDSAWELLEKAYQKQGLFGIFSEKLDGYYGLPPEMLARKKALDRDLENLGIKKYEEEFTDKHQKKLLEAYEKGQLSEDSMDLIKRLKEGYLKKILNDIANNKQEDASFVV